MRLGFAVWFLFSSLSSLHSGEKSLPDEKGVRWHGPAYRYYQHGWIVLHIEGKSYERGHQHGVLMSEEIAAYLRCFAAQLGSKAPSEAWQHTRTLVNGLFLRRFEKEFLEEMQGIADGASESGARFDGRRIDLIDIAALNLWAEIESLDSALDSTPTGLEGIRFPKEQPKTPVPPPMDHCSAFVATGPATADGKIVFGHITMFSLYPSNFYNVWLDVQPSDGFRVVMQSYPGGIQSAMDYYMNDKGLLVTETTIRQTKFNAEGMTLASRIRKALQYADSIEKAAVILQEKNNGLYTNEWLLADIKTNEIALLELGTHQSKLMRSSKGEWFGGTDGFYWGCNNTKDLQVRLDSIASLKEKPENVAWQPSERDKAWLKYYQKYKGKISLENAKEAFTTAPLAAYSSLDVKITTTEMAKKLQSLALFGPPLENVWEPTDYEKQNYPEIKPLLPNPWTLLHVERPNKTSTKTVDFRQGGGGDFERGNATPLWRGTLLPKSEGDVWFTGAFAEYEKLYSMEKRLKRDGSLSVEDQQSLAVARYPHRTAYFARPTSKTASKPFDLEHDAWVRAEIARGIYALDAFRTEITDAEFEKLMESVGETWGGKTVEAAAFEAMLGRATDKKWMELWKSCSRRKPMEQQNFEIRVEQFTNEGGKPQFRLSGQFRDRDDVALVPRIMELTIEFKESESSHLVRVDSGGNFSLVLSAMPVRAVMNKYHRTLTVQGGTMSTTSFTNDLSQTLIVYGTKDYEAVQKAAAEKLHLQIRRGMFNYRVPVVSDREIDLAKVADQHLLLIGTPRTNLIAEKLAEQFPVKFASGSFELEGESYANFNSGIVSAIRHPKNPKRSVVMLGGLSGDATYNSISTFGRGMRGSELVLIANGKPRSRVLNSDWVGTFATK